jgi:uncharacterized membrane protein YeaQ/YmgE (transglycosylase-associated protein family)
MLEGEVRDSVDENDVGLFDGSRKYILTHTGTESRGTLSFEHQVWVLRILNPSIHSLQLACQVFVAQVAEHAARNNKKVSFVGAIQIVERKRKETIIEGHALATSRDRLAYARSQKSMEFFIGIIGSIVLILLLLFTYPWPFRNFASPQQTWMFSVFEKFIGSVAVTTLISYVAYRSFLKSLRQSTIRWSIPGEPEKLDVKAHT